MLRTTHIDIYWQPLFEKVLISQFLSVMWIDIAEVKGTSLNLPIVAWCFVSRRPYTIFTNHFKPVCQVGQWAFTSTWRADVLGYWQDKWQFTFWNSCWSPIFPMNNWNWLTPVTLTAKEPVAETVVTFSWPQPFSSNQATILAIASSLLRPFKKSELTWRPSSVWAASSTLPPSSTSTDW